MSALYRQYDRTALDVQYNARATVPDIQPILAQYAAQSQAARATLPCAADVPYGEHPDELLDIFPAAPQAAAPAEAAPAYAAQVYAPPVRRGPPSGSDVIGLFPEPGASR